uniref:protein kinase 4-like isoform X1 n=1 Tax=Styela clava TaxID=7725 RepID=UPI00193A6086|nr:protein kinase 4-like isoform X1 [Styela clava]
MEVVTISLSALFFNVLCILSFISYRYYKRSRTSASNPESTVENDNSKLKEQMKTEQTQKKKQIFKKPAKVKRKNVPKQLPSDTARDSDTESYTLDEQLAQTIMSQQFTHDVINTSAVNAKPTVKKSIPETSQTSTKPNHRRKGLLTKESVYERDEDWSNVISKKHKKKLYPVTQTSLEDDEQAKYGFTLDEEGGIVEIPMLELSFPSEAVMRPLQVHVQVEKYKKFVDDTEEKVYLTPAIHFSTDDPTRTKLHRQVTLTVNTKRMMGRGWDGNVNCQIEKQDADSTWTTTGRTEYIFGKPVKIQTDELGSYRVVLTRGQNGAITRGLRVAAYIAKPKVQNPDYHFIHLCVFDKSIETEYKVQNNMQKFLLKMEPRNCSVLFGSDLQFRIKPTQKYSPDERDVFMRWTEICKAFVNVHFQIKLTKNEFKDPNFEAEYRTQVFLDILKVSPSQTTTQSEYFHFYWISATFYPKRKNKKGLTSSNDQEKISEDDGFASGSESTNHSISSPQTSQAANVNFPGFTQSNQVTQSTNITNKKRRNRKKKNPVQTVQSSSPMPSSAPISASTVTPHFKVPLPPSGYMTPHSDSAKTTITNNVQSTVKAAATQSSQSQTNNKKPSPMKHDTSANQKASSTPKNQTVISGTGNAKPQTLNVQSSPPTVHTGNSHTVKTKKPQISSKTEKTSNFSMKNGPKNSVKLSNEHTTDKRESQNAKEGLNERPFKKVFRYRSPSKKRSQNFKKNEPQDGANGTPKEAPTEVGETTRKAAPMDMKTASENSKTNRRKEVRSKDPRSTNKGDHIPVQNGPSSKSTSLKNRGQGTSKHINETSKNSDRGSPKDIEKPFSNTTNSTKPSSHGNSKRGRNDMADRSQLTKVSSNNNKQRTSVDTPRHNSSGSYKRQKNDMHDRSQPVSKDSLQRTQPVQSKPNDKPYTTKSKMGSVENSFKSEREDMHGRSQPVSKDLHQQTQAGVIKPHTSKSNSAKPEMRSADTPIDRSQPASKDSNQQADSGSIPHQRSQGSRPQNQYRNKQRQYNRNRSKTPNERKPTKSHSINSTSTNGQFHAPDPSKSSGDHPGSPIKPRQYIQHHQQLKPKLQNPNTPSQNDQNHLKMTNGTMENGTASSPKEQRQRQFRGPRKAQSTEANHIESSH